METNLVLNRTNYKNGTNGTLSYNGEFLCFTIELPWLNNAPGRSCIPVGTYRLLLRFSLKHKTHLLLEGVQDRQLILVHPANNALKELRGCIAPVMKLTGHGKGERSVEAFKKLMQLVLNLSDEGPVFLTIK